MSRFHYVYILIDEATGTHFYVGSTADLKARLAKHNAGGVPHTAKYRPWRIKNAIAFENKTGLLQRFRVATARYNRFLQSYDLFFAGTMFAFYRIAAIETVSTNLFFG